MTSCVAQELPPTLLGRLRRLPVRLALDLYNPVMVEVLEAVAGETPARPSAGSSS